MSSSVKGTKFHSSCTASCCGIAGNMGEDLMSPSFPAFTIKHPLLLNKAIMCCAALLHSSFNFFSAADAIVFLADKRLEMSLWAALLTNEEAHQLGVISQGAGTRA